MSDPANRGSLRIEPRVIEKIAAKAVTEVDGTTKVLGALRGLMGSGLPGVTAKVAGDHATVRVDVAVLWPADLPVLLKDVHDNLVSRVGLLAGVTVDRADLSVVRFVNGETEPTRRVS